MADLNEQHSFTTGQTNDEMLRDSSLIADGNKDDSQMLAKEGQNTTNWLQNGNVLPDQFDRKSKFIDRKPAGSDEIVEQTDTVSDKAFDDKARTDLSASTVVNPSSERRENRMQNTYSSDIDVINEVSGDTGYSLSTQRELAKSSGEHVIQKSYTKPNNILKMTKNLWMSAEYDNIPDLGEHQITLNTGTDDKSGDVGDGSDEDDDDDMNSEMSYERSDLLEDLMTTQPKPTSFFKIFQFADCLDYILMLTGLIGALGMGTLIPVNFVVYGRVLDLMIASVVTKQQNMTLHRDLPMNSTVIFDEIQNNVIWFCIIGCAVIGLAFAEMSLWLWTSERQTHRMRQAAFWAILNKHQGWFDCHHVGELTSRLNDDILAVQVGLGDKFAKTLEWTATFMAGYIIGFIEGWKLTLVILAVLPLLGIVVALFTKIIRKYSQAETESYAKAGAISEEVFAAINTVVAFGGEEKETDRYSNNLESARLIAIKKGLLSGVVQGIMWFIIFSSFGLAFWYGSKLVADGEYTGGQVLQIFLGMLVGTTSIGHVIPYLETLSVARGAAANVFNIIEQKSELDSSSTEGTYLEKVSGTVQFSDVVFSYPTRKSVKILNGLSFTLSAGQIMAVVGSSGCGKSTIIQLIQRFYDPDEGKITLDGVNLKELNLKWLRNQVGVVSQQPVLFSTTISENIRMGKLDLTQAEVENAAKQANVHQFIISLPKKYDTLIGEQGSQLSGGQKQRIAIARALVRNPKILLLDEATSALDTQSESIVQQALNEVSKGRTTLIIAHRLSTIKSADIIIGLEHGQVIEKGSHDELISFSGLYSNLVKRQWSLSREMSADSLDLQDVIINEMPLAEKRARLQRQRTINRLDSTTISYHRITSKDGSVRLNYYRSPSVLTVKQDREDDKLSAPPMKRILNLNSSETAKLIMGCVGAMLMGGSIPVFSVVLSDVLGNFATNDKNALMEDAVFLAYMFVIIGVVCAFGVWAQNYFFAASGANLTMKIRKMVFAAILKQEIGWFDDPQNNVGSLCSRLSNDAAQIQGAAGQQFGMLLQAITNMGTAIIIAVVYGPKLSGVIFVFIPLMFAAGIVQGKMVQDNTKGSLHDLDESAQVASEAIDNIRTVASLTREQYFQQKYESKLHTMYIKVRKNSFIFGAFYAVSQSIIFFSYAATFSYGGVLIERGEMEFHIVFRVFACLIFGSMSLGRALSWMPNYNKAKVAAAKIFYLLDREPKINRTGVKELTPETCGGHITLHNIVFSYPSRPDLPVLHNLSLSVLPGQTVAIVGTSGCGKSTIIKLLERFYEPSAGYVNIDNYDLSSLSLVWLRSQMGLVAQEPVLFDLTIRENIAYGDNSRDIQMDEIIAAARLANIHSFIESLPLGYETNVGGKGMQLSGGQKQRIAIARALIRNPKILLLDEATSALDNESEKLIQEALDKARQDRTTVVIAHRLTTVKHADVIVVIHNGVVVEEGTHKWLMHQRGFYYGLHRAQKCLKHSWKRQKNDVN